MVCFAFVVGALNFLRFIVRGYCVGFLLVFNTYTPPHCQAHISLHFLVNPPVCLTCVL